MHVTSSPTAGAAWRRGGLRAEQTARRLQDDIFLNRPGAPQPLPGEWWFSTWGVTDHLWPVSQGDGVTVAVLDTGVQADLPEFRGAVSPGTDLNGGNGWTDTDDAPVPGHGTGMAALIAGQGGGTGFLGVAPKAKILPVNPRQDQTLVPAGIRYAVDHGAKVINMSIGDAGPCPADEQQAVSYAIEHDVVLVAAAGNDGDSGNASDHPADCAGVLAVGAVDRHFAPWTGTERQPYVAVAAPGVDTIGLLRDGQIHTSDGGTSGATALTSAGIALMRSRFPTMSAREVVQRVIASARPTDGLPTPNESTGYGLFRPAHALLDDLPKNAPNPVFDAYDKWVAANRGAQKTSSPSAAAAASRNSSSTRNFFPLLGMVAIVLAVSGIFLALRRRRT